MKKLFPCLALACLLATGCAQDTVEPTALEGTWEMEAVNLQNGQDKRDQVPNCAWDNPMVLAEGGGLAILEQGEPCKPLAVDSAQAPAPQFGIAARGSWRREGNRLIFTFEEQRREAYAIESIHNGRLQLLSIPPANSLPPLRFVYRRVAHGRME